MGLSTQIPVRAMYHTSGGSRYIKINGENRIKLVHINPKKIIMPNTVTNNLSIKVAYRVVDDPVHNLVIPINHPVLK